MFVKKFKRKCSVRGCKNVDDVFLISRRREMGNTVAMCRECMKEALAEANAYVEPQKVVKEPKPLFPHPELEVTPSSVAERAPEPQEVIKETAEEASNSVAEDVVTLKEKREKSENAKKEAGNKKKNIKK